MKPALPLVSYLSSDDEDGSGGDDDVQATSKGEQTPQLPSPSVHTSLGVARRQPLPGDWLCFVFVPLSSGDTNDDDDDDLGRVFRKAIRRLRAAQSDEESQSLIKVDAPHISLTRPILLRKHECDQLVPCVREALQAYRRQCTEASRSRLTIAFSSFSALPGQDATRTYWAADVSQGWAELRSLTKCLDAALSRMYARSYFEQPRFHASFAHQSAACAATTTTSALASLNEQLGARLRACKAVHVASIGIAIGSSTQCVKL